MRVAKADLISLSAAREIRDSCQSAETELIAAKNKSGNLNDSYRTSLLIGQIHTMNAYRASLFADWPASLSSVRAVVDDSLTLTLSKLSPLTLTSTSSSTASAILDAEIARLHGVVATLNGDTSLLNVGTPAAATPISAPTTTSGIPDLVAGSGFTGATQQPASTGTGAGSDAKVIARWDVVPYQTVTGKLPVGVVAFHMAGIDRVEFSVNGGAWTSVTAMTQNPVTGVWEYSANVDAATLSDGTAEVRAIVYPKVGTPRVLAGAHDTSARSVISGEYSLFLSANKGGTLSQPVRYCSPTGNDTTGDGSASKPFATIQRAVTDVQSGAPSLDGTTIYLATGDYAYPSLNSGATTSSRWITLSAAPGLTNDKVRLTSSSGTRGLNTKLLRVKNLTIRGVELDDGGGMTGFNRVWADGCVLEGSGPLDATRFFPLSAWTGGIFVTDCTFRNVKYPVFGQMLTRNVLIDNIGGDAIREPSGLLVNCEIKNIVNLDDTHNDVIQFWDSYPRAGFENVIVYGLKAVQNIEAQALFVQQYGTGIAYDNFAFVNYMTYAIYGAQWQNPGKHLLLWNSDILSPPEALAVNKGGFMFCDVTSGPARATNVHNFSMKGCVLQRFNALQTGSEPALSNSTSWADNNHFIDVTSYTAAKPGSNATSDGSNSSLFANPTSGDFTPAAGSVLLSRMQSLVVPVDVAGRARNTPDAIGAATK